MIRPKVQTKFKVKDLDKLARALRQAHNASVTVGVAEGAGTYPDGTPVTSVAWWNEFGTVDIPERSFIRSTVNENGAKLAQWREEALRKIMTGWSVTKALQMVGTRLQILVQNKIKSNVPPPNAESTRRNKERRGVAPRTLIDTTLLLRSIAYAIHLPRGQGSAFDR